MTYQARFLSIAVAMCLAACGGKDDNGDSGADDGGSTTGSADGGPGGDTTSNVTDATAATSMGDSGGTTAPATSSSGGSESSGGPLLPDGAMCASPEECESGNCYDGGILGGICGECDEDADCPNGGCSVPNPLTGAPSACNDGGLGGGCESSDVCMEGLTCALILEVDLAMISVSTCSECSTDADCSNGQLCSPTYDVANISGHKACVEPGSVDTGLGCDFEGSGNDACMSGLCTPASAKGFVDLGICSDCGVDGMGNEVMCPMGGTCTPAEVSLSEGLLPGTCM